MWRGMPLEVVSDNDSPAPIYVRQWDIVVLTGTWCCECLLHLAYVLAICVCVVLHRHLVVCVGYMCVCGA